MTNIYSSTQLHSAPTRPCSWSSRIIAGMLSWEKSRFGDTHTHTHIPELKLWLPEFNESLESESCCWVCFCCPETHPSHASKELPLQGTARTQFTNAWQMFIHFARLCISSKPQPNLWDGLEKLPMIPPLVALRSFGNPNFKQVWTASRLALQMNKSVPCKRESLETWALYKMCNHKNHIPPF